MIFNKVIHDEEELQGLTAEDLREYIGKLARYAQEIEEERDNLRADIEDLKEEIKDLSTRLDAKEEDEESAGLELASACETFLKYQEGAGGEWYKRDLRDFIQKIASACMFLETSAVNRIENAAPIF